MSVAVCFVSFDLSSVDLSSSFFGGVSGCSSSAGRKGERSPVTKRELVDLHGVVEVRFGLARAPRRPDGGFEHAVGEEVEPLAVGAPSGLGAVVAVGGDGLDVARFDVKYFDLVELIGCRFQISEPAAVGRPGQVVEIADHRLRDAFIFFGFDVVDPELLILVAVGEPVAIRRGNSLPAQHLSHRWSTVRLRLRRWRDTSRIRFRRFQLRARRCFCRRA